LQPPNTNISNFLVGVAPASMDLNHSIGQEGCGIGLDYYGYIYINGKYFHVSNLANWQQVAKPCRGSTARHKGKAGPMFRFHKGKCEITLTLDLKEGTLRFSSGGHSIGTLANVKGPMHAALTLTSTKQAAQIAAGEPRRAGGCLAVFRHGCNVCCQGVCSVGAAQQLVIRNMCRRSYANEFQNVHAQTKQ
jgi:hypothetical protein